MFLMARVEIARVEMMIRSPKQMRITEMMPTPKYFKTRSTLVRDFTDQETTGSLEAR